MNRHRSLQRRLAGYQVLPAAERAEVDRHLEECATCRDMAADYERQDILLRNLRTATPSVSIRDAVQKRIHAGLVARSPWWQHVPSFQVVAPVIIFGLAILLVIAAALEHGAAIRVGAPKPPSAGGQRGTAVERAVAARLGFRGSVFVGNQAEGLDKPWTIWTEGTSVRTARRVLSVGPRGVQGPFAYYDIAAQPGGRQGVKDPYRGPHLPVARAIEIADAWLRRVGASVPRQVPHVQARPGTTIIGGTGLCCFSWLNIVYWDGSVDRYGLVTAYNIVYVADAGKVVQVGWVPKVRHHVPAPPICRKMHPVDANSVELGTSCFDYASAAGSQMTADIGGHGPWIEDPREVALLFVAGTPRPFNRPLGFLRTVSHTPTRIVYAISFRGTTYRLTVVRAFPDLPYSVWMLVRVQRVAPPG